MRVNFSVTNQLATPSIHAAALANRPPAGQPGRLFVDTDNPSTGIYRDTGTVWENITGGAGAGNLQTVTDAGNTTDNNIELTFADNNSANKLSYYNIASAQIEYAVERRAPGITTNDCLVIESQKINSPTDKIFGILLEPGLQRLFTYYDSAYLQAGLICNFSSNNYGLYGTANGTSLDIDDNNSICSIRSLGNVYIGDTQYNVNGTTLNVDESNSKIKTAFQGNDIGLYLDFANNNYLFGDFTGNTQGNLSLAFSTNNFVIESLYSGNTSFSIFDDGSQQQLYLGIQNNASNNIIKTNFAGADIGLKLDFANIKYTLGDPNNELGFIADIGTSTFKIGDPTYYGQGTSIIVSDVNEKINTTYGGNDIGLKLDFGNGEYNFGDFDSTVNGTAFAVDDTNQKIVGIYGGTVNGLELDFANSTYKLGDISSNFIGVDHANNKLIASTNLLVGSSGPVSGQHLKIKVGGTDYVIELKDP